MLTLVTFVAACSLVLLVFLLTANRNQRVDARVQNLSGENRPPVQGGTMAGFARVTLPKLAKPLVPENEENRSRLRSRLIHAGLYGRNAMGVFLGIKMLLMLLPVGTAMVLGLARLSPLMMTLVYGLLLGCAGMFLPNFWLDMRKKKRQTLLRRSLPDALDVIVICLEGGLSLQGAFQRVVGQLSQAHPLLAAEMMIIQREIQLGRSTGEAMREFADRTDLEEVRSLGAVVLQAERLGASVVKSLRVHADTLRVKRLQRAEELAHMAGTKMVFPTLLCIFPAILFVVAGPAAYHIIELFSTMK
ncbi:MAG: type II secretion system F family protein [Planctomycetes bacterium]|nr:type II secretion system F family protein [Planctomycetota bacterium]